MSALQTATAVIVSLIVIGFLAASIKVVREYERGILFRLGRLIGAKGPARAEQAPISDGRNLIVIEGRMFGMGDFQPSL